MASTETVGESSGRQSTQHLIDLILNRNDNVPAFALLIGSGASATSGVLTATEMVAAWRRQVHRQCNTPLEMETWLRGQDWFQSEDEYSILFEMVYDQSVQRRDYIEHALRDAHPGWGYVYLSNVLREQLFNVVLTTNFDDLVNEACYMYTEDVRPIVCAHDSAVSSIRVTSRRPKIIKIHGDFLFDNIKNTLSELETLEDNIKSKIRQFAQEYGLVVVGYGGRDQSVMQTLDVLVRNEEYFKHGVYWCLTPTSRVGRRLRSLFTRDRVYPVDIAGFDEFMASLHEAAHLELPEPVRHPIRAASNRSWLFMDVPDAIKGHDVVKRHIAEVDNEIREYHTLHQALQKETDVDSEAKLKATSEIMQRLISGIPPALKAMAAKAAGQLQDAVPLFREALKLKPDDRRLSREFADCLAQLGHEYRDELRVFVLGTTALEPPDKSYFLLHARAFEDILRLTEPILDTESDDAYIRINRAIALKRLNRSPELNRELEMLEKSDPDKNVLAGIAALRNEKQKMLKLTSEALGEGLLGARHLTWFPVFEEYFHDPDWLVLVQKQKEREAEDKGTSKA